MRGYEKIKKSGFNRKFKETRRILAIEKNMCDVG